MIDMIHLLMQMDPRGQPAVIQNAAQNMAM